MDDENRVENGYLSIAQEGNKLDILPVGAGVLLSGTVTGTQFVFIGKFSEVDPVSGDVRNEEIEGLDGAFTAAQGEVLVGFEATIVMSDGQCARSNVLVAESVYQHNGQEDYSHIYKAEKSGYVERLHVDSITGELSEVYTEEEREAFTLQVAQAGLELISIR